MGSINIDMDGVLAIYNKEDYANGKLNHEIPGGHYFADRAPDGRMCLAMQLILDTSERERVHVVSSLSSPGHLFAEQLLDKLDWLERRFDGSPYKLLLPVTSTTEHSEKARRVTSHLGRPLNAADVLVDDYNIHLVRWRERGGTAVKYLNGINSAESWNGACITPDMDAHDIVLMLAALSGDVQMLDHMSNAIKKNRKEE